MEREGNISVKAKKHVNGETHAQVDYPPWLDLLEPVAELILDRLPLLEYVRFGSVCKKWQSIQKHHRLRYAPLPPPMPYPLPWLMPFCVPPNSGLICWSPLDQKSYSLSVPSKTKCTRILASCHGWLLLFEDLFCYSTLPVDKRLLLYNPITCVQILLPLISGLPTHIGLMSAPPTDPECTILFVDTGNIYLHRLSDRDGWVIMQSPFRDSPLAAVYFAGNFYIIYNLNGLHRLYIIDLNLPTPKSHYLEMEIFNPVSSELSWVAMDVTENLFEADGELFLVKTFFGPCGRSYDFRVFKADLSRKKWFLVETLGDRVLFLNGEYSLFLFASDVGCLKNCIYFTDTCRNDLISWMVFDLETKGWIDEAALSYTKDDGRFVDLDVLFFPSLDSANLAEANAI